MSSARGSDESGSPSPQPGDTTRSPRRMPWVLIAWLLLYAVHLVLLFNFLPLDVVFSERPIINIDHSLHYYQVDRAAKAFHQADRLWGYDPHQLAGYPAGAVEDMSSKAMEYFVIALMALGLEQGLAFNLYILLIHLLVPLLAWGAARMFRLDRGVALLLALLWILLWYFDSFLHWCWYCGMVSWVLISMIAIVVIQLVARIFACLQTGLPPVGWWLGAAISCATIGLFHPLALPVVAICCGALYLRALRQWRLWHHVFVVFCIATATAGALIWLLPALPVWRYVVPSHFFLRPTLAFVLYDFFDLHLSASGTGPPVQTMLRFFCLAAAAIQLWRWRREGDSRWFPLSVLLITCLFIAYGGRYFWLTSTAQPYRTLTIATLASAVPAAVLLGHLFSWRELRALSPAMAALLIVLGILAVPRLVRTYLYYFPDVVPFMLFERRLPAPRHPINAVLGTWPRKMESSGPPRGFREVRSWLLAHHQGRGRVLVQEYELGEYLAATTDLPIVGGFDYRTIWHGDANLFQFERKITLSNRELEAYFQRYAIGYVLLSKIHWKLENNKKLLSFRQAFDGIAHRIFATRIEPGYLMRGSGQVVSQQLNRLVVKNAGGAEVVLRFHWLDSLRCRPKCTAERYPLAEDRVGFIRIRNPPARFEIYNSYIFP